MWGLRNIGAFWRGNECRNSALREMEKGRTPRAHDTLPTVPPASARAASVASVEPRCRGASFGTTST